VTKPRKPNLHAKLDLSCQIYLISVHTCCRSVQLSTKR